MKFITNAARCGVCRSWLKHPSLETPELKNVRDCFVKMLKIFVENDMAGLSKQEKDACQKGHTSMQFPFMEKQSFLMCYDCKQVYYAGAAECGAAGEAHEEKAEDLKDRLCTKCSRVRAEQKALQDNIAFNWPQACPKHGDDFIVWKCYFCCHGIARFCCGGYRHFCEPCHGPGWSAQIKACLCPIPDHAPNGTEKCFGCQLCRSKK